MARRAYRVSGRRRTVRVGRFARRRGIRRRVGGRGGPLTAMYTFPIKDLIGDQHQAWLGICLRAPIVQVPNVTAMGAAVYTPTRVSAVTSATSTVQNYWIKKVEVSFQVPSTVQTPMMVASSLGQMTVSDVAETRNAAQAD